MIAFIAKRMVATIPVMGVVALFVFLMLRLSPGDPAAVIAGDYASPGDVERIREALGLNEPIVVQFGIWIWTLMRGDLGISIFTDLPVTHLIRQRVEPTIMLSLTTIVFSILVAVPMGVVAAWKSNTWIDRGIMIFAVAGFSIPVFVLGYMLIWQFSLNLQWLPVQGYTSPFDDLGRFLWHITLPTITLSMIYIALIARITRASVLDVLEEDYIRTARSKGLSERVIITRHALKNASLPIITICGWQIGRLIAGTVIIEQIFLVPGMGKLLIDSVFERDFLMVQNLVLVIAVIVLLLNLFVDLMYGWLDPRIRYE